MSTGDFRRRAREFLPQASYAFLRYDARRHIFRYCHILPLSAADAASTHFLILSFLGLRFLAGSRLDER